MSDPLVLQSVERRFRTWAEGYGVRSRLDDTNGMPGDSRRTWGLVGGIAYTLGKSEEQGESNGLFWGFDERYPTVADRPRPAG